MAGRQVHQASYLPSAAGMATGALYMLCDSATSCTAQLTNSSVSGNKALWADAASQAGLPSASEADRSFFVDYYGDFITKSLLLPSIIRFFKMVPWLTYTYPLSYYYQTVSWCRARLRSLCECAKQCSGLCASAPSSDGLRLPVDASRLLMQINNRVSNVYLGPLGVPSTWPTVTGRTLGAVVLQQRGAPVPGSASAPGTMRVTVSGTQFGSNDGAGMMNSAVGESEWSAPHCRRADPGSRSGGCCTEAPLQKASSAKRKASLTRPGTALRIADFMELAGGTGQYTPGSPPRHSADFTVRDVTVSNHASGYPAMWLRWVRSATLQRLQVRRGSGAEAEPGRNACYRGALFAAGQSAASCGCCRSPTARALYGWMRRASRPRCRTAPSLVSPAAGLSPGHCS
jgi:hypothetical protein